jgi:hypothetical protein
MPDDIVELGAFQDEPSAWIARAVLEASGIRSQVISLFQSHGLPGPVRARLAVRAEDAAAAMEILKQASDRPSA